MATAKKTSRATSRKGGAGAKKKAQASGATQEIFGFALMVLGIFSFVAVVMGGARAAGREHRRRDVRPVRPGGLRRAAAAAVHRLDRAHAKRMRMHPGKLADERDRCSMLFVINHLVVDGLRAADRARDAGERGLLGLHRLAPTPMDRPTTSAPARWGES